MQLRLSGVTIVSERAFHDAVRVASGVEWYGGSLDALFDLLVAVVPPPIAIVWDEAARSRAAIGARFDRLIAVMLDAVAYRGRDAISVRIES